MNRCMNRVQNVLGAVTFNQKYFFGWDNILI